MHPDHDSHLLPKTGMSGCMKGCLVVIVFMVLGGVLLVLNARNLTARAAAYLIKTAIEESDLPADQKAALITRVDKLRTDFTDGRITDEQLKRIGKEVFEGPLMPVGAMLFMNNHHVKPSGLNDQEKQDAQLTLQRLARGVSEKKISHRRLDPIFAVISTKDDKGNRQIKKSLTDTELRDFLTLARREVDKENISTEPMEIDLVKEFDAAVERGLAEPVEMPF